MLELVSGMFAMENAGKAAHPEGNCECCNKKSQSSLHKSIAFYAKERESVIHSYGRKDSLTSSKQLGASSGMPWS
jgi:hypothetical protein